MIASGSC